MGKYGRGMPGFVISPGAAHASIMCGFTHDVGTVMAQCHPPGRSATCLPGCMGASDSSRGISHWCDSPAPCSGLGGECNATGYGRHSFPTCPWPPQKLMELMERHVDEVAEATCSCCHWSDDANDCSLYNEIIFDAHILAKSQEYMLANIEAVFFPADRPRHVEDFAIRSPRRTGAARHSSATNEIQRIGGDKPRSHGSVYSGARGRHGRMTLAHWRSRLGDETLVAQPQSAVFLLSLLKFTVFL